MAEVLELKKYIVQLIDLQRVDAEIYDLQIEKESYPERVKEIESILETKKNGMQTAEAAMKELQVSKSNKENDLRACEEKIKKHESELAQIKTNKEYKAMLDQIDGLKADVSLLEESIIGLLDEVESAQQRYNEEKKIFEEEARKSEKEKGLVRGEEEKVNARLDEIKAKRKEIAGNIDGDLLMRYEKILENRGRCALAKVNGEFCGECNMRLRPQVINEATLQKKLVICENCSRILYTED